MMWALILLSYALSLSEICMGSKTNGAFNTGSALPFDMYTIDISSMFQNDTEMEPFSNINHAISPCSHIRSHKSVYFETDLNKFAYGKIENVFDWFKECSSNLGDNRDHIPEIILSLRYNATQNLYIDGPEIVHYSSGDIPLNSPLILKQLSLLPGVNYVAFEDIRKHPCVEKNNSHSIPYALLSKMNQNAIVYHCKNCSRSVKVGYVMSHALFNCARLNILNAEAEYFILKVNIPLEKDFVESYGAFKRYMNSMIKSSKEKLLKTQNNNPALYYHIQYFYNSSPNSGSGEHTDEVQKFCCLFKQFLDEWVSTTNISVILKLEDYTQDCNFNHSKSLSLFIGDINEFIPPSEFNPNLFEVCNFLRSLHLNLETVRDQGFDFVTIQSNRWLDLQQYLKNVSTNCTSYTSGNVGGPYINVAIYFFRNFLQFQQVFSLNSSNVNSLAEFEGLQELTLLRVSKLIIRLEEFDEFKYSYADLLPYKNKISFSCQRDLAMVANIPLHPKYSYIKGDHLNITQYLTNSSDILELCDDVILTIYVRILVDSANLDLHTTTISRDGVIVKMKNEFLFAQAMIVAKWPYKRVILEPIFTNNYLYTKLFCDPKQAALTEYNEAILTWAEIHNISVILKRTRSTPVSWQKLLPEVAPAMVEQFPIFIRQSFNKSRDFGTWQNGMYPCVNWGTEVQRTAIKFDNSQAGTIVQFNLKTNSSNSQNEISTMLLFGMHAFKMIEIIVDNHGEILTLFNVMSHSNFKENLDGNGIYKRSVYLHVALTDSQDEQNIFETIDVGVKNISNILKDNLNFGVHFSKLPEPSNMARSNCTSNLHERMKITNQTEFGIVVDDCTEIVNILGKVQRLEPQNEGSQKNKVFKLLDSVSYLVCTFEPKYERNRDEESMMRFFQTHLYIKRILQIFFPNINQVYFKMLTGKAPELENTKELLLLLDQMLEFSTGHNVPYFILPAYSPEHSREVSWWKISNYSDLSIPEIYQDIHSAYLGMDTLRPTIFTPDMADESITPFSSSNWIAYGLASIVALLVCILTFVIVRARMNPRLLSDAVFQEFMKGMDPATGRSEYFNGLHLNGQYNQTFEIPKANISFDFNNVLGSGNFGIVYKANVTTNKGLVRTAAVKLPLGGCNKETFIGMLREVKLLCFLGIHQNIIEFIGCYTQEIQNGVLYVVMELCQNGCLLAHLRNIKQAKSNIHDGTIHTELVRFCKEIASGMEYISGKNVIHGDLSARNVLLDNFKVCKISDFGLSRKLYQYTKYTKKSQEPLPWRWMSYETLVDMEYTTMADVWSFGITAWEVFSLGEVPYSGLGWSTEFTKKLEEGMRLAAPNFATDAMYEMMKTCWLIDCDQRPDFKELVGFFAALLPYDNVL